MFPLHIMQDVVLVLVESLSWCAQQQEKEQEQSQLAATLAQECESILAEGLTRVQARKAEADKGVLQSAVKDAMASFHEAIEVQEGFCQVESFNSRCQVRSCSAFVQRCDSRGLDAAYYASFAAWG